MTSYSSISLTKLFLLTTISSSVISLPYDNTENLIPENKPDYEQYMSHNENYTRDNVFNSSSNYTLQSETSDKINTILEFSKKIINNSKDIESEFVDIVNEKFWDLL